MPHYTYDIICCAHGVPLFVCMFRVPISLHITSWDQLESSPNNTFYKKEDTHLLRSRASSHEAQHKLMRWCGIREWIQKCPEGTFCPNFSNPEMGCAWAINACPKYILSKWSVGKSAYSTRTSVTISAVLCTLLLSYQGCGNQCGWEDKPKKKEKRKL